MGDELLLRLFIGLRLGLFLYVDTTLLTARDRVNVKLDRDLGTLGDTEFTAVALFLGLLFLGLLLFLFGLRRRSIVLVLRLGVGLL